MSDATNQASDQEAKAREYVAQLRSAPVSQIVAELLTSLLNAAQVKLGRRDARLLIDLSSLLTEHARRHLPAELTRQIDQALHQLRLGQVRAEGEASGKPEPNDLAEVPVPPAGGAAPAPEPAGAASRPAAASPPPPQPPSAASKLWIPGRDF
ncbi:MAG TPA: hypothetical protein VIL37_02825 [Natronosporangium sp.]